MAQARTEFAAALNQIASEKGVETKVVLDAIRQAALAAYKKDLMLRSEPLPEDFEEFTSEVDPVTGAISIFHGSKNVTPPGFARIAASIAKQVIMQRLNEAERDTILAEYEGKIGAVISGTIQRQEGNTFFVDLGRAEGVLPPSEQVHTEMYHQNQRLKFLVKEIREGGRGSEVIVSRSDPELVKALFALEVPEIQSGAVEIKVVAREAGSRTKIAASSKDEGIDPVGSLVGQKGVRVQAVIGELGEEKIDIISYSGDPARFIAAALSPAKDIYIKLNEADKIATATVPTGQLSLAIGKGGQNVRLAAKLTGWKIDIVGAEEEVKEPSSAEATKGKPEEPKEEKAEGTGEKKEEPSTAPAQAIPADDAKTVQLPPEKTSSEEEKAEATDPGKTVGEAVAEAVEENITEAEQQESVAGQLEEEDQISQPQAAADAEADIEEEDQKSGKSEEETAPAEEAKADTEKAKE